MSRPFRCLIEYGLLAKDDTFFDYGCGLGDDLRALGELGYTGSGWDPVYRPDGTITTADVVNLGFVLNVIEEVSERVDVLRKAFDLAKKVMCVATMTETMATTERWNPYKDGVLTQKGTFQKYFKQEELGQFLEDVLHVTAVPVELGVFLVFKSEQDHQTFVSERTKRNIDWEALSYRLYPRKERKAKVQVYESNKSVFDDFWSKMVNLGRIPTENEYPNLQLISDLAGSPRRARTLFIDKFGIETLEEAFRIRKNDMLVYMALANFKSRVPFKDMPKELQIDIKTFLGGYKAGQERSRELLYSISDPELIAHLCDQTTFGYCDNQALYIHHSLLSSLHPVLRIYVGCASVFYGDLASMDIIKIHKRSSKVTLHKYDNFMKKSFPQLLIRVKVDLRCRKMDVFDHTIGSRHQLLYRKYRYMREDFSQYKKWKQISDKAEQLGLDLTGYGPSKQEFMAFLDERGLTAGLRKKRVKN